MNYGTNGHLLIRYVEIREVSMMADNNDESRYTSRE